MGVRGLGFKVLGCRVSVLGFGFRFRVLKLQCLHILKALYEILEEYIGPRVLSAGVIQDLGIVPRGESSEVELLRSTSILQM